MTSVSVAMLPSCMYGAVRRSRFLADHAGRPAHLAPTTGVVDEPDDHGEAFGACKTVDLEGVAVLLFLEQLDRSARRHGPGVEVHRHRAEDADVEQPEAYSRHANIGRAGGLADDKRRYVVETRALGVAADSE